MKRLLIALVCGLVLVYIAAAQPTLPNAVPMPTPEIQYLDAAGKPLAGAKLCTYAAGTSTPLATYTDSTAGTPNTNPVVLNTAGRASVWVGPALYKFVLLTGGSAYPASDACTTGTIQWTQDNVSDTTLYFANYVKTLNSATLVGYTPPYTGGVAETVSAKLAQNINVKDFGAVCDGAISNTGHVTGTDDSAAINLAFTAAANRTVELPNGICAIAHTVWMPSNTGLLGKGGRSASSTIAKLDGMYYDAISSGVWDGTQHSRDAYTTYDGGYPYNQSNTGTGISIKGVRVEGNANNAGQPPGMPAPPTADYRGSNIWVQFVDGVLLDDVLSEWAPNDCAGLYWNRNVQVANSEFGHSHLINPVIGDFPTRNGLSVAGTFSGLTSNNVDSLQVSNVSSHDNDNLGITIQARTLTGGTYGGSVTLNNIVTYNNWDEGVAMECCGGGAIPVKNSIISNWSSNNDGWGRGIAGGIDGAENVILSNITMQNVPRACFQIGGGKQLTINGFSVQGWDLAAGDVNTCMFAWQKDSPSPIDSLTINGLNIAGAGRAGTSSAPLSVIGVVDFILSNSHIQGGKYSASFDGTGSAVATSAVNVVVSDSYISGADALGMIVGTGNTRLAISNTLFFNNGQSGALPGSSRAGLRVGPASVGTITNSGAFDSQGSPTQQYGFIFDSGAGLTGIGLWGQANVVAPISGVLGTYLNADGSGNLATGPFTVNGPLTIASVAGIDIKATNGAAIHTGTAVGGTYYIDGGDVYFRNGDANNGGSVRVTGGLSVGEMGSSLRRRMGSKSRASRGSARIRPVVCLLSARCFPLLPPTMPLLPGG